LVALLLSLAGCSSDYAVDVTLLAPAGLPAASLAAVRTLALQVSGAESGQTSIALDGFAAARVERFRYRPHAKGGQLTIAVSGNDQHGIALIAGQGTVALKSGAAVKLTIPLALATPLPLAVTPSPATVGRNSILALSATREVGWKVVEASGGSIDSDGHYQAPAYPGLFHVIATDAADATASITVPVTVGFNQVVTLAGAAGGLGNVDAVGTAARFNFGAVNGVLIASSDGKHLYVADRGNHIVRRIDVASAAVTTILGVPGVSGTDDSPLQASDPPATLRAPYGLAVDAAETRLYIADLTAATIRVADLTETPPKLTTLCGVADSPGVVNSPTATQVRFNSPAGLALDEAHATLYLADYGNDLIRAISTASGATTAVAGTAGTQTSVDSNPGPASFGGPVGIAFDGTMLYVSDENTHVIRTVNPATMAVTTLAGTAGMNGNIDGVGAAARLTTPSGLASIGDATSGTLVIAEYGSNNITTISKSNGTRTTIAGPSSGSPSGWVDGLGTQARFAAPGCVAVVGADVFVYDSQNSVVRRIAGALGSAPKVSTWAGAPVQSGALDGGGSIARFTNPWGAVSVANDLYVGDFSSNTIRKIAVTSSGGSYSAIVSTVAGTPGQGGTMDGAGSSAQIGSAHHLAFDGTQTLYFADYGNNAVRSFDLLSQQVKTLASSVTQPHDVAVDMNGAVYVTQGLQIVASLAAGATKTTLLSGGSGQAGFVDGVAASARFASPGGILVDPSGFLYVGDSSNNALRKVSLTDGSVTTLVNATAQAGYLDGPAAAAQMSTPFHIIWTPAQQILIADMNNQVVRVYDPATQEMGTVLGVPSMIGVLAGPAPGGLNTPRGLALLTAGELAVTSFQERVVVLAY
jgi:sugar lactone lactonase YvrE